MANNKTALKHILILVVLSYLFFMVGNGILSLTNPDEVFYAQTAKEMMQAKSWTVPYLFGQPNFEKPIFTYWLLRLGFAIFGVSNFGARFFPALFALIGVIAVYLISLVGFRDERKAFLSGLILMSAGLYIGLARTVFTDMIFTVFILLSMASFFWGYTAKERKAAGVVLFFIFSALAVLTKGPLGLILPLSAILLFLAIRRELGFLYCRQMFWGGALFLLIAMPWYVFVLKRFGDSFTKEFFYNDHIRRLFEAEHRGNDTWFFYPLSMIMCMFPWSIFIAASFFYFVKRLREKDSPAVYLFLGCWVLTTFVIFQVAHSKLVSYIFPLFPALAMIAADAIHRQITLKSKSFSILMLINWFMFLSLPVGLIITQAKYAKYLPGKTYVYNFVILYGLLLVLMLFLVLKRKPLANVFLLAIQIPVLLLLVLPSGANLDMYASSKDTSDYLLNNYSIRDKIICSKPFVRGVRYFTDKDVAVIGLGGGNFFSPHPIVFLDSDKDAKEFLEAQPLTYCVLTKSSLSDMQRIVLLGKFKLDVLKVIGKQYIVRVQRG